MILQPLLSWSKRTSIVTQIVIGLVLGIALGLFWPDAAIHIELLGTLFISALKAVAPILVFVLVIAAISNQRPGQTTHLKPILWLYVVGTLSAAIVGVLASMLFPSTLVFKDAATGMAAPSGINEVLVQLMKNAVDNPVSALMHANYIGILVWAVAIGIALRRGSESTRQTMAFLTASP
jgi:serine/threonine transporter